MINVKRLSKSLSNNRLNVKIFLFFLIFIFISVSYMSSDLSVPYLGTFSSFSDLDILLQKQYGATRGVASFPEWTKAMTKIELLYKAPIQSVYFIFSPFPWDVSRPAHLIGMFDSFLYMYLAFLIFCNRKIIWEDPVLRIILIILVSYIIVFGIGVGNFGTGIRHRSKFAIMFILLAAPLVKRIIFSKNKKKYK